MALRRAGSESGRVPLIGWLVGQEESDTVSSSERAALREGLARLGWIEGRNLRIEWRFGAADAESNRGRRE